MKNKEKAREIEQDIKDNIDKLIQVRNLMMQSESTRFNVKILDKIIDKDVAILEEIQDLIVSLDSLKHYGNNQKTIEEMIEVKNFYIDNLA